MEIETASGITGIAQNTEIYASRRERVRKILPSHGLDALLVSLPANRFYLSGFELHDPQPTETSGYIVISADGMDWLATDSRYELAAKKIWNPERVYIYTSQEKQALANLLVKCGTIIGVETDGLSLKKFNKLKHQRKKGHAPIFTPADGIVESLRMIKDDFEITSLEKSFQLNHSLLHWLEQKIAKKELTSMTEKELSWEIEVFFRQNGAQELAFSTIVANGTNGVMPHAIPTDIKIANNSPLLVDLGCRVDNYCSDQTRTFWIGDSPSEEFSRTLELVKRAQKAALSIMRPGVEFAEVYKAAVEVFREAGVEKAFTHGLGHGVGLETHEKPSLSPVAQGKLEKGMVVTVEPGLYYPSWGGVRWEYTVLIEENEARIL